MENDTGSWRLFGGIAGQPTPHDLTLHHTSYAGLCYNCHQTQHECINVISGNEIIEAERIKKVN